MKEYAPFVSFMMGFAFVIAGLTLVLGLGGALIGVGLLVLAFWALLTR